LQAFKDRVKSVEEGKTTVALDDSDHKTISDDLTPRDRMVMKPTLDFGKTLADADVRTVAQDTDLGWLGIWLLINRHFNDDAARLVIADALRTPTNSSYRLWKWMEVSYGNRPDYDAIVHRLTDGLLRQFETGSPEVKLAVAGLFRKTSAEASMSLDAFKEAIGYPKK
jgi:hypothetical protein